MADWTLDPAVSWLLRAAVAALLAVAAVHKLRDPGDFLRTLADYRLLPTFALAPAVAMLVACEGGVAAGLLWPPTASRAGLAAALLFAIYAAAIGINLLRGRRDIDCGCLGPAGRGSLSGGLVARNAVLVLGSLLAALPAGDRALTAVDGLSLAGGVTTLGLLYVSMQTLASDARPWRDRRRSS